MITVRSTINLAHQSVPEVIPAVQGDTGRSILFTLADFTIPAGATARYFITKPSGLAVYNDATIDGNTVLVDLTAQSLAEYGDCPGQVRISVGDTVVTSFEFILHVEPFRGIDAVESTTETNIFDQAVEDAREAIAEAAEEAEEYISQALDTTLTIPDKAADAKATGDAISDSADAVIAQMRAEIANVYPTETAQGNPATFDDGAESIPVKDLKVEIVPQQDLHGYDKPWPEGGGKNLCEQTVASIKALNTDGTWSGNAYTWRGITYTILTDSANNVIGYDVNGTASARGWLYISDTDFGSVDANYNNSLVQGYVFTSDCPLYDTSRYLCFYSSTSKKSYILVDGVTANHDKWYPMVRLSSVSDATFEPYSNLCPITGMTAIEVERTGKNLLPMTVDGIKTLNTSGTWSGNAYTWNGITYTIMTDSADNVIGIKTNGTATGRGWLFIAEKHFDDTFIIYGGSTYAQGTSYSYSAGYSNGSNAYAAYDNESNRSYILVAEGVTQNNQMWYPIVRTRTTDAVVFEPYHTPQTVTTDLGRTVYGGQPDITTGELVVTRALCTVSASRLHATTDTTTVFFGEKPSDFLPQNSDTQMPDIICNQLEARTVSQVVGSSELIGMSVSSTSGGFYFRVPNSIATTLAEMQAYLANNPMYVCYPLATPVTYQLTPQEVLSVLGTNHISTDAESVEVVYRADIALYIENLTEPDADMIADTNITSGSYFMVGNTLYLATANIANGAAVVVGTNCVRSNLASALNAINA